MRNKSIKLATVCLLAIGTGNVNAAGFALIENGAGGMGNAYAGASAVAEDASTVYFNPAGLSKLKGKQFVAAAHYISTKVDFTNNGSSRIATFGGTALPGSNSDGGGGSLVPSLFYANQINDKWTFGLGITVPFGLGTEYDEGWVGRYHAVKSEIQTLNINPSAAFKVNDKLSVGFGVSYQYIEATLSNKIDSAAYCQGGLSGAGGLCNANGLTGADVGDASLDSAQSLTGEDWSFGWNIGLLYDLTNDTRLGMSYRSNVDQKLTGDVDFTVNSNLQTVLTGAGLTLLSDTGISAGIDLPESISMSLVHNFNTNWTLLADATWMKWERYDEVVIDFVNPSQPNSVSARNYQNSWRYSLGAIYSPDDKWKYRIGVALDESAVRSATDRTARSPGNDRLWLSMGFGYKTSESMQIDVGYTHLFIDNTPIDNSHVLFGTVTGSYEQSVDILSAQINWLF